MSVRTDIAMVTVSLALVFTVAGCTGSVSSAPPSDGSYLASAAPTDTVATTGAVDASAEGAAAAPGGTRSVGTVGSSAGPSASDLAAMRKQLDAMQKEIDALALPSDADYSGAEGAIY